MNPFLMHKPIKPRGNISLIMLFVLAIGSLIGLMSTTVIQNMITSSGQLRDFYHSYYLAQAGLELGTLAVHKHQYGYEDTINYDSTKNPNPQNILNQNLNCKKACALDIRISSRLWNSNKDLILNSDLAPVMNSICTKDTKPFSLAQGQSLILPLFMDQRTLSDQNKWIQNIFNQTNNYHISLSPVWSQPSAPTLSVILWSTNQATYDQTPDNEKTALTHEGIKFKDLLHSTTPLQGNNPTISIWQKFRENPQINSQNQDYKDYYNYLAITNTEATDYKFCFKVEKGSTLITDTSHVEVISRYNDTALGFQATVYEPLLDYIPNTSLEMN